MGRPASPLAAAAGRARPQLPGYWRILQTKKLGRQKFAIIYDLEATHKAAECIYLMSSLLTAQAATIARHYLHRWEIETSYHDTKQLLGLGDYQIRLRAVALRRAKARALSGVYRHLLMVDVAYTALAYSAVVAYGYEGRTLAGRAAYRHQSRKLIRQPLDSGQAQAPGAAKHCCGTDQPRYRPARKRNDTRPNRATITNQYLKNCITRVFKKRGKRPIPLREGIDWISKE